MRRFHSFLLVACTCLCWAGSARGELVLVSTGIGDQDVPDVFVYTPGATTKKNYYPFYAEEVDGVTIAPDGNAFVAGNTLGYGQISKFNYHTGAFADFSIPFGSLTVPMGLAYGPDGYLYAASNALGNGFGTPGIMRYNATTGALVDTFIQAGQGGLLSPHNMTFGTNDALYVCDGLSVIREYSAADGSWEKDLVQIGDGGLTSMIGVAIGPDGDLYTADYLLNEVFRFDANTGASQGVFVTSGSGGLSGPSDLQFGPDGNLYINSKGTDSILEYDGQTGSFIQNIGSPGPDGAGSFPFLAVANVPEPGLGCFAVGSFAICMIKRNGKRRAGRRESRHNP